MKKWQAYFRMELERLFCKKEFYFSILGIVLILFLSANDGMGNIGDSVLSAVLLSSYDAGFLIAFSLATFSYGTAFVDELLHGPVSELSPFPHQVAFHGISSQS